MIYRQGDVLLRRVEIQPNPDATITKKNIVLAYGEVTGHAHRITSGYAKLYTWEGDRLLELKRPANLTHEEHATIALPPGMYQVIQQREYTPEAIRNVTD